MSTSRMTIHTDGASRGNPGDAAYGFVIDPEDGYVIEDGGCLGKLTNNVAEYTALVHALERAVTVGTDYDVEIFSDSELMVKQVNGVYRVKKEELRPLHQQVCALMQKFTKATLKHVRREQNKRADELCNEALDGKRKPSTKAETIEPEEDAQTRSEAVLSLRESVLNCLREAKQIWSEDPDAMPPESVWEQILVLFNEQLR